MVRFAPYAVFEVQESGSPLLPSYSITPWDGSVECYMIKNYYSTEEELGGGVADCSTRVLGPRNLHIFPYNSTRVIKKPP